MRTAEISTVASHPRAEGKRTTTKSQRCLRESSSEWKTGRWTVIQSISVKRTQGPTTKRTLQWPQTRTIWSCRRVPQIRSTWWWLLTPTLSATLWQIILHRSTWSWREPPQILNMSTTLIMIRRKTPLSLTRFPYLYWTTRKHWTYHQVAMHQGVEAKPRVGCLAPQARACIWCRRPNRKLESASIATLQHPGQASTTRQCNSRNSKNRHNRRNSRNS